MCEVCERKSFLGPELLRFLGAERFEVEVDNQDQEDRDDAPSITITNRCTGERFRLTADGDGEASSYFHWERI